MNVTAILNQNNELATNGCEVEFHEVTETFQMDPHKDKKIIDRIISHQLIILENPGKNFIEQIKIREFMEPKTP